MWYSQHKIQLFILLFCSAEIQEGWHHNHHTEGGRRLVGGNTRQLSTFFLFECNQHESIDYYKVPVFFRCFVLSASLLADRKLGVSAFSNVVPQANSWVVNLTLSLPVALLCTLNFQVVNHWSGRPEILTSFLESWIWYQLTNQYRTVQVHYVILEFLPCQVENCFHSFISVLWHSNLIFISDSGSVNNSLGILRVWIRILIITGHFCSLWTNNIF